MARGAIDYSRLADLYDAIVRFDEDLPFFRHEAARAGGPVLELMCGTGRVTLPLLEAGVGVMAIDASLAMLAVLRRRLAGRGLEALIVQADVATLTVARPFPLAILPFQSFAELIDDADRRRALTAIHACLTAGGTFLCTLHNPAPRLRDLDGTPRERGRAPAPSGDGELVIRIAAELDPATRVVRGIETLEVVDGRGTVTERRDVELAFALLEREAFESLATAAGFAVEALYGDYAYAPFDAATSPYMIWRLRKA